jgi:hypothetical protein
VPLPLATGTPTGQPDYPDDRHHQTVGQPLPRNATGKVDRTQVIVA